ncbi:hypothetical protein [Variovorax sp. LjRoot178]|uniref:hypothetical protein n=1 Tax=Variovorax sp. LjRoot178 TaxID=3342277 RepID=UPI003ECD168B
MHPNDFPLLRAAAQSLTRLDAALVVISNGIADGATRNVALQDAKFTLSNAVENAWRKHVSDHYFTGEACRNGKMSEILRELFYKRLPAKVAA